MSPQAVADTEQAVTYPADAGADTFLLSVRGTPIAASLEEARKIHNATAGSPQGIAGARALGDLSHNVYAPYGESASLELLFIDYWNSLSGLGEFFQNPMVHEAAGQLFSSRDGVVWARATGFGEFHLTVPSGPAPQGVGLIRARVTSIEDAARAFQAYSAATINVSRLHGLVSHSQYTRVPNPGEDAPLEVFGVDIWLDADRMSRYYDLGLGFEHFSSAFAGPPETSIWQSAPGEWAEW